MHPIIAEAAGIEQDRLAASPGCDIENTLAEQVALTCLWAARCGDHDRHLPAPWQRIRIVDYKTLLHEMELLLLGTGATCLGADQRHARLFGVARCDRGDRLA